MAEQPPLCGLCQNYHFGPCPLAGGQVAGSGISAEGDTCGRCGAKLHPQIAQAAKAGQAANCPNCEQPL